MPRGFLLVWVRSPRAETGKEKFPKLGSAGLRAVSAGRQVPGRALGGAAAAARGRAAAEDEAAEPVRGGARPSVRPSARPSVPPRRGEGGSGRAPASAPGWSRSAAGHGAGS